MICVLNWLELVNRNDKSQTIYCINRDCDSPYIEERMIDDCDFVMTCSPDASSYRIDDLFDNSFWAEDCFLTLEEAEEHLAKLIKEQQPHDDNEEVWIISYKSEVHKVKAARVRWYSESYKTKEEAEKKAEEYNRLDQAVLEYQKKEKTHE